VTSKVCFMWHMRRLSWLSLSVVEQVGLSDH